MYMNKVMHLRNRRPRNGNKGRFRITDRQNRNKNTKKNAEMIFDIFKSMFEIDIKQL
jgi:hypothetical protein